MSKAYTQDIQTTTSVALAWSIAVGDNFDVKRINLTFDTAPTTSEDLTVTLDSGQGAAYDTVLYTVDPSVASVTNLTIEELPGFMNGDALLIEYTNTDTRAILGTAVLEQ